MIRRWCRPVRGLVLGKPSLKIRNRVGTSGGPQGARGLGEVGAATEVDVHNEPALVDRQSTGYEGSATEQRGT